MWRKNNAVDGDNESGEFSVPGKPPHIAYSLAVHLSDHGKGLLLRSGEGPLIQLINIRPLAKAPGRRKCQQMNQLLGPYFNSL